jgi:hypothetical protein
LSRTDRRDILRIHWLISSTPRVHSSPFDIPSCRVTSRRHRHLLQSSCWQIAALESLLNTEPGCLLSSRTTISLCPTGNCPIGLSTMCSMQSRSHLFHPRLPPPRPLATSSKHKDMKQHRDNFSLQHMPPVSTHHEVCWKHSSCIPLIIVLVYFMNKSWTIPQLCTLCRPLVVLPHAWEVFFSDTCN